MNNKCSRFIKLISPLAMKEYSSRKSWVLPSVCIAQAAIETGWGNSTMMNKANAFFGIKATSSWKGKTYNSITKECYDGVNLETINASFRAYDNLGESVSDYYDLITNNPRYSKAVNNSNYKSTITAIKEGGYATDPSYISKVCNIIEDYNLTQYDLKRSDITDKTIDDLAKEVISGNFGNGEQRRKTLGDMYDIVQTRVNYMLRTSRR